jgi:5-methylcytosine-specific restriction enzyme B
MADTKRDVINRVKNTIANELRNSGYTVRTSGTKNEELKISVSEDTGFWENPSSVTNKPPRWLIHFEKKDDEIVANFATTEEGEEFPGARTLGYINNREGNCAAMIFRILAAIKERPGKYVFPDWEWLLTLVFKCPLPAGTSGEAITNFDPIQGTITYAKKTYPVSLLGIVKTPVETKSITVNGDLITYDEATEALKSFLNKGNKEEI